MCREKIQGAVLASYADELERSKLPGYISRYDDLDAEYDLPATLDAAAGAPSHAPMSSGQEPPLRRAPLRSHTQHSRGNQSVLRGPHVPPRKDVSHEGVGSDRGEANGFGNGL
jgi:stage V sporulation protein G